MAGFNEDEPPSSGTTAALSCAGASSLVASGAGSSNCRVRDTSDAFSSGAVSSAGATAGGAAPPCASSNRSGATMGSKGMASVLSWLMAGSGRPNSSRSSLTTAPVSVACSPRTWASSWVAEAACVSSPKESAAATGPSVAFTSVFCTARRTNTSSRVVLLRPHSRTARAPASVSIQSKKERMWPITRRGRLTVSAPPPIWLTSAPGRVARTASHTSPSRPLSTSRAIW
mmetsp:Transcript_33217/g.63774  ORF Transcript_33217/g.63774 Transcript_33217/m.63774 type:complete len:229 (-) Transcript_33217:2719-3405(-)